MAPKNTPCVACVTLSMWEEQPQGEKNLHCSAQSCSSSASLKDQEWLLKWEARPSMSLG